MSDSDATSNRAWVTPCGAELRSLTSDDDYEQCLSLQRETWGDDFRELVPPTILAISQKVGGVLAGAFQDGRMLAFVYGLSGFRDGERAHWSHMLAVTEGARGRGLGKALKAYQRALLEPHRVASMYWSYDPLIARNASLNLKALGARPVEYVRDMYGADTGSTLHSGLGTDRFVVRWKCAEDGDEGGWAAAPSELPSGDPSQDGVVCSTGERLWVEIPADIDALKTTAPELARSWREATRGALERALARGPCIGLARVETVAKASSASAYRYFYAFRIHPVDTNDSTTQIEDLDHD